MHQLTLPLSEKHLVQHFRLSNCLKNAGHVRLLVVALNTIFENSLSSLSNRLLSARFPLTAAKAYSELGAYESPHEHRRGEQVAKILTGIQAVSDDTPGILRSDISCFNPFLHLHVVLFLKLTLELKVVLIPNNIVDLVEPRGYPPLRRRN